MQIQMIIELLAMCDWTRSIASVVCLLVIFQIKSTQIKANQVKSAS